MERKVLFAMLACVVVGAAPVAGQVYKWVDQNGTVHFSDSPPATPPAGAVELRNSAPPPRMVEGQPQIPPEEETSVPGPPPADDEGEPETDDADDPAWESEDSDVVVEPGDGLIYDPDVIDRLRRERLRERTDAPARDGSGVPVRAAPRRGRR